MVRNQPYDCQDGYVQLYKCNRKAHYGCEFQWKLMHDVESSKSSPQTQTCHRSSFRPRLLIWKENCCPRWTDIQLEIYRWLDVNTLNENSGEDEVGVLPGWNENGPDNLLDNAADVTFMLSTKNFLKPPWNKLQDVCLNLLMWTKRTKFLKTIIQCL